MQFEILSVTRGKDLTPKRILKICLCIDLGVKFRSIFLSLGEFFNFECNTADPFRFFFNVSSQSLIAAREIRFFAYSRLGWATSSMSLFSVAELANLSTASLPVQPMWLGIQLIIGG